MGNLLSWCAARCHPERRHDRRRQRSGRGPVTPAISGRRRARVSEGTAGRHQGRSGGAVGSASQGTANAGISNRLDRSDPRTWPSNDGWRWVTKIVGLLLTVLAISLGAPFWFDLLNKFMVVRSTVKPREKSRKEKSKD